MPLTRSLRTLTWRTLIAAIITVAALLMLLTSAPAQAQACQKLSEVCVQGPQTRTISGYPVYKDCWQYQDVFQCVDPANVNYCSALQANPTCSQASSVCTEFAFSGACLTFMNTFECSTPQAQTQGIAKIAEQFTITRDEIDESACTVLSGNPQCTKTGRVCVQGPETRIINGLAVTKPCWQWQDTYSCSTSAYLNYCQAVANTAGCNLVTDVCGSTAPDGSCMSRLKTYSCGAPVNSPNITLLNTSYTIAQDTINTSACTTPDTSSNCTLAQQVCTQGPETRIINGMPVYKDCWSWDRSYTCIGTSMTANDCGDLIAQGCTKTASVCVDTSPDGSCANQANTYQCVKPSGNTQTVTNCGGQMFCMNGSCFDTGYAPDADFLKATASMEAAREAGNYLDPNTFKLFNGKSAFCSDILGGLGNCCKTQPSSGMSNAAMSASSQLVHKVGGEVFKAGSNYVYDALYGVSSITRGATALAGTTVAAQATVDAGMTAGATAGSAPGIGSIAGASSFSFYGATFSFSAAQGIQFVSFDPWSFALQIGIQVVTRLLACDQQEQLLAMKRGQNLCQYVGDYCATKFLGSCVQRKQGWCCFNSTLMKTIATAGRSQLGRGWGTAQNPDCGGFDMNEIAQLDFSQMDFSEFFNEITSRPVDPAFRGNKTNDLVQQRVQNYFNTGRQNSPAPTYTGPPQ